MSGSMSGLSEPKTNPDIRVPFGINRIDPKCRKCRVFSTRITSEESETLDLRKLGSAEESSAVFYGERATRFEGLD